jgi:hypothetical protein
MPIITLMPSQGRLVESRGHGLTQAGAVPGPFDGPVGQVDAAQHHPFAVLAVLDRGGGQPIARNLHPGHPGRRCDRRSPRVTAERLQYVVGHAINE